MSTHCSILPGVLLVFLALLFCYTSNAYTFTVTNNCPYTIWPGTLAGSGTPQLASTGFQLEAGQSVKIPSVPAGWSGRIWGRTGCSFDASGVGVCQTGDCGGKLECNGNGATPPASLFEITFGVGNLQDFYDVSIVDGYNLPLVAAPRGVYGACNATGCAYDLNMGCPKELQVVGGDGEGASRVIGCKSACEAFREDQYCCSGEFANPTTCRPSFYSAVFKQACPRAYSYAFDDATSTFTCKALDYLVIFCPNSQIIPNYVYVHLCVCVCVCICILISKIRRTNRTDTGFTPPPSFNDDGTQGKVQIDSSSNTLLFPLPVLILLLIVNMFL